MALFARPTQDDRVLPATRLLSIAIVPFLVVAFAVLYLWPNETDRLFAWTIRPALSPMVLGSVYLGGAYFFFRVALASQWHTVKAGFLPVTLFASLMGIATIVHWERFNHGHVAFWLWAGLYFSTPFLVPAVWLANRRQDPAVNPQEVLIPASVSKAIGVVGTLAVVVGLLLFLFPMRAIDLWPWQLTPLTARIMGAIFALGVTALGSIGERRWSAARLMLQVEILMVALVIVAGIRARTDLDPSNPITWLVVGGFLSLFLGSVALGVRMSTLARSER
jgi:hypothetical protein